MDGNGCCRNESHLFKIKIYVFEGTEKKENPQQGSCFSAEVRTWNDTDDDLLFSNITLQLNSSVDCVETSHCHA
jgi:hypothetical protein